MTFKYCNWGPIRSTLLYTSYNTYKHLLVINRMEHTHSVSTRNTHWSHFFSSVGNVFCFASLILSTTASVTFYETIFDIYAGSRIANPTKVNQSDNYAHHDKCQYCTPSNEYGLVKRYFISVSFCYFFRNIFLRCA